jgi:hypothetical protein
MLQDSSVRTLSRRHPDRLLGAGMILLLSIAGGCGSGDGWNRQAVSGVVTVDGHPLGDGAILLEPPAGEPGMAVGATIRRGNFDIRRDQGPTPGTYLVRIYSSSGKQAPPGKGQTESTRRPMVERLPDIYNTRSELRADVTAGGPNRLRFELHTGSGG